MKFRYKLFLFLSASIFLLGFAMLFLLQIPITGILSEKVLGIPALRSMNIQVKKIDATASGKVTLYGMSILGKDVVCIPTVTIFVNRKQLLHGNILIESVHMDTVKVNLSEIAKIKDRMPPEHASWFHSKLTLIQKTGISVGSVSNLTGKSWKTGEMRFRIDSIFTGGVSGAVKLKSLSLADFPAAGSVDLKFVLDSNTIAIKNLRCQWAGGVLKGAFVLDSKDTLLPFQGRLELSQINLGRLATLGVISGVAMEGRVQGKLKVNGRLNHLRDIQADGNLKIVKLRLKNSPFQRNDLLEKHLPDLKDFRLSLLEISGFSWKENRIHVAKIDGHGNPFSFSGSGSMGSDGNPSVKLECTISPKYFQSLSPLLQGTREMKIQIDSVHAGGLLGRIKLQRITISGLPAMETLEINFDLDSNTIAVKKFLCKWADGTIQGAFAVNPKDASFPFQGSFDFQKINLIRFTALGFFGRATMEGRIQGNMNVHGRLSNLQDVQADGNLKIVKVRLKKFPVQRDKLIVKYFPGLKDLRLDLLEISKFSWKDNKGLMTGIKGLGNPLSFSGKGRVGLHGVHSLRLNCAFNKKYCQKLNPIIRAALNVNGHLQPRLPCEIKGNLQSQTMALDQAFSRVVGGIIKSVGNGFLDEFDLTN